MSYKEEIRQAHIAALRQKYLDIIDEARRDKEAKQKQYDLDVRDAYVDKMNGLRDRPQYIRSLGMSGGVQELDLEGLTMDYEGRMNDYKRSQREFIAAYKAVVAKQNRLMQLAVDEYNAKVALEDYNEALKAQKTTSRSSTRRSSGSSGNTSASEQKTKEVGQYVDPSALVGTGRGVPNMKKTYILNWHGR